MSKWSDVMISSESVDVMIEELSSRAKLKKSAPGVMCIDLKRIDGEPGEGENVDKAFIHQGNIDLIDRDGEFYGTGLYYDDLIIDSRNRSIFLIV